MEPSSEREVSNTRAKLARLEARYEALRNDAGGDRRVRQMSMISLRRLINQFREGIDRYEAHQPVRR